MWGSLDIDLDGLDSSDDHRVLVQQYETYTYEYNMNYKSWANVNSDMMTIKEFGLLWDWYRSSLSLDHRKGISIHSLVDECVASNVFQSGENTYEEALKFFNLMDINGSGFISFSELVAMSSSSDPHMHQFRRYIRAKNRKKFKPKFRKSRADQMKEECEKVMKETGKTKYCVLPSGKSMSLSPIRTSSTASDTSPSPSDSRSLSPPLPIIKKKSSASRAEGSTAPSSASSAPPSARGSGKMSGRSGGKASKATHRLAPIELGSASHRRSDHHSSSVRCVPSLFDMSVQQEDREAATPLRSASYCDKASSAPRSSSSGKRNTAKKPSKEVASDSPLQNIRRVFRKQLSRMSSCEDEDEGADSGDQKKTKKTITKDVNDSKEKGYKCNENSHPEKGKVLTNIRKNFTRKLSKLASFGDKKGSSEQSDASEEWADVAPNSRSQSRNTIQKKSSSCSIQSLDSFG